MLGTIYHTGYLTDDADQAIEFFKQAFGGEVTKQSVSPDGGKTIYVKAGEVEAELIEPADKSRLGGKTGLIIDHVGYFVDDIDQAIGELKAKGIKFLSAQPTVNLVGLRMIYLDPQSACGTRIHLTESKPK